MGKYGVPRRRLRLVVVANDDWGPRWCRGCVGPQSALEDLKRRLGEPVWAQALARVTDTDGDLIDCLLAGVLNA